MFTFQNVDGCFFLLFFSNEFIELFYGFLSLSRAFLLGHISSLCSLESTSIKTYVHALLVIFKRHDLSLTKVEHTNLTREQSICYKFELSV